MKRIALAFYGQLRNVDDTYPYWKKNIIDPLNIQDIYVHTWREEIDEYKYNTVKTVKFKVGPSVLLRFIELYKPKLIMQSDYEDVKKTDQWFTPTERIRFCVADIYVAQYIWFAMNKIINLIDENEYDAIILSRTDNIFVNQIKNLPIENNEILASTMMFDLNLDGQFQSVSDIVVAGDVKTMKKFASIGTNYKKLHEAGVHWHGESLVGENLKRLNVNVRKFFKYPNDHYFFRDRQYMIDRILEPDGSWM